MGESEQTPAVKGIGFHRGNGGFEIIVIGDKQYQAADVARAVNSNAALVKALWEARDHLSFILSGIKRGKIDDASLLLPSKPNDKGANVVALSDVIKKNIAKIDAALKEAGGR